MQATRLLLAASIAATTALAGAYSSDAYAQDDYDDLDLDGGESQAKKARSKRNRKRVCLGHYASVGNFGNPNDIGQTGDNVEIIDTSCLRLQASDHVDAVLEAVKAA